MGYENISSSIQEMISARRGSVSVLESFGNYVLNEEVSEIRSELSRIEESGSFSISDITSIMNRINESGADEFTKLLVLEKTFYVFSECNKEFDSVEESVYESVNLGLDTIKFNGDPAKNEEYIALLRETERFVAYSVELMDADFALADDVLVILENVVKNGKDSSAIKKGISDCLNRFDKGNLKYDSDRFKKYYDNFKVFQKKNRTFNNRYSKITMKEKKIIDERLDKVLLGLYQGGIKDWFVFQQFGNKAVKMERMVKVFESLKEIDRDSGLECLERIINPLINYIARSWSATVNNVNYIRKILGIELEDTTRWKIVHKILK